MRVLFFLEPLIMHSRPFHYWAWLGYFADMARAVAASGGDARLIVNEPLAERALAPLGSGQTPPERGHGLPPEIVATLSQSAIRRLFERPNVAILECLHRGTDELATRDYGELVKDSLDGFVPDVTMSITPARQLARAFPEALHFATETAAYSRAPFPSSLFFDPSGLWDRSIPARDVEALFRTERPAAELRLLADFRERFAGYFRATSPFVELERELREKHRRVAFLPLQFGGESGFDLNSPFRNQGEYLFHVLERLAEDTAVVAVEHPTAHFLGDIIDDETRAYLSTRYPRLKFVDFRVIESAGQYLVHHADFVISVSTSLALQALFFGRPIVAVGTSHLASLASLKGLEALPRTGSIPPPDPALDRLLAWLIARYFVPVELTRDPAWLAPFLERSLARHRSGTAGPEFFDLVLDPDRLRALLFRGLAQRRLDVTLENGRFERWSRGPGPFAPGGEAPDGWHLLDFGGVPVQVRRASLSGSDGVRIERLAAGSGPTLFLQRVPDLARSAGALARLRFRARSEQGASLACYFYLQVGDGQASFGSLPRRFDITSDWQLFEHFARLPELGDRQPGAGNHLEVVFALGPSTDGVGVELADVALGGVGESSD